MKVLLEGIPGPKENVLVFGNPGAGKVICCVPSRRN